MKKLPSLIIKILILNLSLFFFIFLIVVCFGPKFLFKSSLSSDWILVWNDEFNNNKIDPSKWRIEDAALLKNNEKQYYSSDEVYVQNDCLVLRSQKRRKGDREYTSGLVSTNGKYAQKYGRFEMRAKFPSGKGIWPAIWMLPISGKWPPEMDIAETYGNNQVYMTNHFTVNGILDSEGKGYEIPNLAHDFHVFTLEWAPQELQWYIDGVLCFSTKQNIPHEPFYLILNTAIGGDWPGDPDSTTIFSQYHMIDYVRIYQKKKDQDKRF